MTIFDPNRPRVIDTGRGGGLLRLIGLGIIAFVLVIVLFSSITRVDTGHVGVLTLFGRVTGETLGEGIHLINPLKTNNEMSVQTQTIKESASVPSSEGLMMALDTSLIFHLNPDRAAEVFQKIGADYQDKVVENQLRSAIRESTAPESQSEPRIRHRGNWPSPHSRAFASILRPCYPATTLWPPRSSAAGTAIPSPSSFR